jgi:hypothetical protein
MDDLTRHEVDAKLEAGSAQVQAQLSGFELRIESGFANMRTEMQGVRTDMQALRADMHKSMLSIIRWVAGIGLALVVALLSSMHYILSTLKTAPPPAAQAPAPLVIVVPDRGEPLIMRPPQRK